MPGSKVSISRVRFRTAISKRFCALGAFGVCAFPSNGWRQTLLHGLCRMFGELEINVANQFHEPGFRK